MTAVATAPLNACHHAPFGDHGFAHLPGVLRAGDFVDLDRDFLADKILQLRGLGVAAGDELKGFRSGLEIAQPVRRRQPARLAGDLVGRRRACLLAAATLHGVEFAGQDVAGIDRLAGLSAPARPAAPLRKAQPEPPPSMTTKPSACRIVVSSCRSVPSVWVRTAFAAASQPIAYLRRDNQARRRPARHARAASP